MTCNGCRQIIRLPDSPWYIGTRYSLMMLNICGTCLRCIPVSERTSVTRLFELDLCIGPIIADVGSQGKFQACGSTQGDPRFLVKATSILEHIPFAEMMLDELDPYFRIPEYTAGIMRTYKAAGGRSNSEATAAVLKEIGYYRVPIAFFAGVTVPEGVHYEERDGRSQMVYNATDEDCILVLEKLLSLQV